MYFFISYSTDDKMVSNEIFETLGELNIKCWNDKSEVEPMDGMQAKIASAIEKTTGSIVIVSRKYFKTREIKNWCLFELKKIIEMKKLGEEEKLLLEEVSKYRGFNMFDNYDINRLEPFKDFMQSLNGKLKSIYKDKHGYFAYWGTEFGTLILLHMILIITTILILFIQMKEENMLY